MQNIAGLNNASNLLEQVIVVNNASSSNYSLVEEYISSRHSIPFLYLNSPENLGVTRGRNFALSHATGEIIIFLDDDAVLQNKDALENVLTSFEQPGLNNMPVAVVSFKVLYYDTLQMQQNALPHKKFKVFKNKQAFYTYYFAGGAHAIRHSVLKQVGNLPDAFFYGMEEYDLSYRILDHGYCIKYDSSIVMLHKESPHGRKPKREKQRMMWVNKSKVAYRYLPTNYFYSTAIMWSIEYLRKVGLDFGGWLQGWKDILNIPSTEPRIPLKKETLRYLEKVGARLWY